MVSALAVLVLLIAFSERKQSEIAVRDIKIKLENIRENHFIDEGDVIDLMGLNHENLRGANINKVDLRRLEDKIESSRFIQAADLYNDLKGNVVATVELRRPIARLVGDDGLGGYIAEDGGVMPVSDKFTARVVLISGAFADQVLKQRTLAESEEGEQLMEMLRLIREDDFLRAQVAQLDVDRNASIDIYPQVGGQVVEFGKPDNAAVKLMKMKIFFKQILPQRGWNRYKRVSLEYEGQIVAE